MDLFRNYSFRYLWLNQTAARFGDALYSVGIGWLIYQQTQSAWMAAHFYVIRLLMLLLSSFSVPILYQRFSLYSVLVYAQAFQVLALLIFLIFSPGESDAMIYFFILLVSSLAFVEGWISPSRNSYLPFTIEKENLVRGNTLVGSTEPIAMFLGYTCGGLLLKFLGAVPILWLALFMWLCSLLSATRLQVKPFSTQANNEKLLSCQLLVQGWGYIWRSKFYRPFFVIEILESLASSVWVSAILISFVKRVLHIDQSWYAHLNGSYMFGSILGGLLAIFLARVMSKRLIYVLIFDSISRGLLTLLFAMIPYKFVSMLLGVGMGSTHQVRMAAQNSLIQLNASPGRLPEIYAVHKIIIAASRAAGALMMGAIADHLSVELAYLLAASAIILSSFIALRISDKLK